MSMFARRNLSTLFKKSGCGSHTHTHTHTQNMHAYVCIHLPGCYTYKKCPHTPPKMCDLNYYNPILNYFITKRAVVTIVVAVQSFSHARIFATRWTAARQVSLSFTISQSLLKLMSIEPIMPFHHLSSVAPCYYRHT